jgi:hypothetical protein
MTGLPYLSRHGAASVCELLNRSCTASASRSTVLPFIATVISSLRLNARLRSYTQLLYPKASSTNEKEVQHH